MDVSDLLHETPNKRILENSRRGIEQRAAVT